MYAAGDEFEIYGWVGDANCNYTTNPPVLGCFEFIDFTHNWGQATFLTSDPKPASAPSEGLWWPLTVEYVNEWAPEAMNPNYGGNEMVGAAWDTNGGEHLNPGNSGSGNASGHGDDYVVVTETDSFGDPCSIAEWNNGSVSTPEDPMFFFAQTCGPY